MEGIKALTLTVSERCNLSCKYCYVPKVNPQTMSMDVARRALEWAVAARSKSRKLSVAFYGGEPFLEAERLGEICDLATEMAGGAPNVSFFVPTNGTIAGERVRSLIRRTNLSVMVSHDGRLGQRERRYVDGRSSLSTIDRNIPEFASNSANPIVGRMTVTPGNVAGLVDNIFGLFEAGFREIMYLPTYESHWSDSALASWEYEHMQLSDRLIARYRAGLPVPELTTWRGIIGRLSGKPRGSCGAGHTQACVSVSGDIYPCYRMMYVDGKKLLRMGSVYSGGLREKRAEWSRVSPEGQRPQCGSCKTCDARDGCGFFCPAMGHLLAGDRSIVPEVVCRLTVAQVAACRRLATQFNDVTVAQDRGRWKIAAAIAAFVATGPLSGCSKESRPHAEKDQLVNEQVESTDGEQDAGFAGNCPDVSDYEWYAGNCPDVVEHEWYAGNCPDIPGDDWYAGNCPDLHADVGDAGNSVETVDEVGDAGDSAGQLDVENTEQD